MPMRVNIDTKNAALCALFEHPEQTIFLDANFFIPPDRSCVGARAIAFEKYKKIWLEPIFDAFPNLAVHESVHNELVLDSVRIYANAKESEIPSKLKIYYDHTLSSTEQSLLQTYIWKIAPFSKYIPEKDNAKDRGEIKSLSYMAVKGFLYFAANDNLPKLLIRSANELHTGLDDMGLFEMYDVIYYLYQTEKYDNKSLKLLYKYHNNHNLFLAYDDIYVADPKLSYSCRSTYQANGAQFLLYISSLST